MWDKMISSKFSTHRVSKQCTLGNLKKKFSPQKWRPFWIFEFLPKMQKHKFAFISLTMRDRTILSKFSTHRLSKQSTLANFQKFFLSLKMTAILNQQICFYFLNRARYQDFVEIFDPQGVQSVLATFHKNHFPATFCGHLEFLHET